MEPRLRNQTAQNPGTRLSCDRCYLVKERCSWLQDCTQCARCLRLHHTCEIRRTVGKPGRRPRTAVQRASQRLILPGKDEAPSKFTVIPEKDCTIAPSESGSLGVLGANGGDPSWPPPLSKVFDATESVLIETIFRDDTFFQHYLLGPSFCDIQKTAVISRVAACTPLLQDGLFAGLGFFSRDHRRLMDLTWIPIEFWIKRAARAVSALRSIEVSDRKDVSVLLLLGATILTFAPYLAGSNILSICRYVLTLAKPTLPSLLEDADDSSFLRCAIYTECVCCLFQGKLPTIRYTINSRECCVDRYLGVSVPLLPIFYDICKVIMDIRSHPGKSPTLVDVRELQLIEIELDRWRHSASLEALNHFTPTETLHIFQQAHVLRLAALLIIHRLLFAYGDPSNRNGPVISRSILSQLATTTKITRRSIICCEFAFMIACFELQDEIEQQMTLSEMRNIIGYEVDDQQGIQSLISSVWKVKKNRARFFWSDFPDVIPPIQEPS